MEGGGGGGRHRVGAEVVTSNKTGVESVVLQNGQGALARVCLKGARIVSWKTSKGEELLFTSKQAITKSKVAGRGGISVCFPQFERFGKLVRDGFARERTWIINKTHPWPPPDHDSIGQAYVDLLLKPSELDLKIWPHRFEFHLRVSLNVRGNLILIQRVRNVGSKPFSFTTEWPAYFSISDISDVRIEGLGGQNYLDNLHGGELFTEQGDSLTFEHQIDRVYVSTPFMVAIMDHGKRRTFCIEKEGFPDVAVWNPWETGARGLNDFGKDEYKETVCVGGAAAEKAITLKPGQEWGGQLRFSLVPSTRPELSGPAGTNN